MSDVLKRDLRDGLFVLTMNRPERRNALDPSHILSAGTRDDKEAAAAFVEKRKPSFTAT